MLKMAHIFSFVIDLGKGMKAINDRVSEKLDIPNVRINRIQDPTPVKEELDDYMQLYYYSLRENDFVYKIDGELLKPQEVTDYMLSLDRNNLLHKEIEVIGIDEIDFINIVMDTKRIHNKYKKG